MEPRYSFLFLFYFFSFFYLFSIRIYLYGFFVWQRKPRMHEKSSRKSLKGEKIEMFFSLRLLSLKQSLNEVDNP